MLSARDSLAAAEWLRLVASPGAELESAAALQLEVPGGDAGRRQIAGDLLGWARGLASVESLARDPSESTDLRQRRRRLAAAAAVVARGLDGWQTVQHGAKLDRWPSKWLLEARAAALLSKLTDEEGLIGAIREKLGESGMVASRAELLRLRRMPDDLVYSNRAWGAPAREGLLTLIRSLGGASAVDDAIGRATGLGIASDGASQSQASDFGPRLVAGDYSITRAAVDAARETGEKIKSGVDTGLDLGLALGFGGLVLGVLVLVSSDRR